MKLIEKIILFSLVLMSFGCSKWLDVKPEDKFIEEEVYKHPQGFMDGLNGIYLNLGSTNMYGFQLNMGTLDLLAQYYYISPSQGALRQQLVVYNFEDATVRSQADQMWTGIFKNVLSVNSFLNNLEVQGKTVLDETSYALFKGEALGLRAYLYLDLLRLFTPNYSLDPKAELIPYSDKATSEASPYRTSEYVAERILEDLKQAEDILQKYDPAIKQTVVDQTKGVVNVGNRPHLSFRNYRMNYYAVLGLKARTLLWMGDKVEALKAAEQVIVAKSKFPWIKREQVGDKSSPNRVFSTEMLFGFENTKLYQMYDQNFTSKLAPELTLYSGRTNDFLNKIYEGWEVDMRLKNLWERQADQEYLIFVKYEDLKVTSNMNFRYTVPGIQMGEIFLIAAECEPDKDKGLAYLNELREHRDCLLVTNTTNLEQDIMNEARREFYGLGQMWYFYKRQNSNSIYSATTLTDYPVGPRDYVFPLPYSETEPR